MARRLASRHYDVHGERISQIAIDDTPLPLASEHEIIAGLSAELQTAYAAEDSLEIQPKYSPRMHAEREAWRRDMTMALDMLGPDLLGPSDIHIQSRVDERMTYLGSGRGWPGIPHQATRWRRAAEVLTECLSPDLADHVGSLVEAAIDHKCRIAGE